MLYFIFAGMPDYIWKMLLQQASWSTDTPVTDVRKNNNTHNKNTLLVPYATQTIRSVGSRHPNKSRGGEPRLIQTLEPSWQELVGDDATMRRSMEQVLELPEDELAALELDFVGAEVVWNSSTGQMDLAEVSFCLRNMKPYAVTIYIFEFRVVRYVGIFDGQSNF
jgi:hypothetical protein